MIKPKKIPLDSVMAGDRIHVQGYTVYRVYKVFGDLRLQSLYDPKDIIPVDTMMALLRTFSNPCPQVLLLDRLEDLEEKPVGTYVKIGSDKFAVRVATFSLNGVAYNWTLFMEASAEIRPGPYHTLFRSWKNLIDAYDAEDIEILVLP